MKPWRSIGALLFLSALSVAALAQTPDAPVTKNTATGNATRVFEPSTASNFFSARTPYEFWLTVLVALVGLIIIYMVVNAIARIPQIKPEDIAKPIIIIAVITSTLILVTAGFSNEQIAPAFGLLGTIVGYVLGKLNSASQADAAADQPGEKVNDVKP